MLSQEQNYLAEQEYNRFEELINTKEYLTKEEFDFCIAYDKDAILDLHKTGDNYLNLNVYSEHEHEKRQYEMETNGWDTLH